MMYTAPEIAIIIARCNTTNEVFRASSAIKLTMIAENQLGGVNILRLFSHKRIDQLYGGIN